MYDFSKMMLDYLEELKEGQDRVLVATKLIFNEDDIGHHYGMGFHDGIETTINDIQEFILNKCVEDHKK